MFCECEKYWALDNDEWHNESGVDAFYMRLQNAIVCEDCKVVRHNWDNWQSFVKWAIDQNYGY